MEKAAGILMFNRDGLVLAATRRGTTDQWGIIGGKKDVGETVEECALREYEEETGLVLTGPISPIYRDTCEAGTDGKEFDVWTYLVVNKADILQAEEAFTEAAEVEPGILVKFVGFDKIITGPFGPYNSRMLNFILSEFNSYRMWK